MRTIRRAADSRRRPGWVRALLCAVCLAGGGAAHAGSWDLAIAAGAGSDEHVNKAGLIVGWSPEAPLWQGERWRLRLRHEGELAAWHVPRRRDLLEVGYSPVFRLERPLTGAGSTVFLEGAIGVRLISHTRLSDERNMSTAFQFSDMLGAGWQFGPQGRSTLGLRVQHLSNAGIKRPNPGINFVQVYWRWKF